MATDRINQTIKLNDGRTLGYAEYGAPEGKPIFYFHALSSRLDAQGSDEAAIRLNIRVIAIDRPGIGISDSKPGRTRLDWPDDVVELADTLGIDRFAVVGLASGGPYAAACAFKIPQRLTGAAIINTACPFDVPGATKGMPLGNRFFWFIVRRAPWLLRLFLRHLFNLSQLKRSLPGPDLAVLERPEIAQLLNDAISEGYRSGTRGLAYDMLLATRDWGFQPQEISIEVHLWHGEADTNMPPAMGRYVANAIPNCHAKFLPDEGHISLVTNHMEEILSDLLSSGDW